MIFRDTVSTSAEVAPSSRPRPAGLGLRNVPSDHYLRLTCSFVLLIFNLAAGGFDGFLEDVGVFLLHAVLEE